MVDRQTINFEVYIWQSTINGMEVFIQISNMIISFEYISTTKKVIIISSVER
jgi:hypothetical protein